MSSHQGNASTFRTVAAVLGGAAAAWLLATHLNKKKTPEAAKPAAAAAASSDDGEKKAIAPKTPFLRGQSALPPPLDLKLRPPAIIVVDPVSTGANLADEIMRRKIPCIRVFSRYVPPALVGLVADGVLKDFAATIYHDDADYSKTIKAVYNLPYTVTAVIAGSELGTELADSLGDRLGVRSNGAETSFLRRDKFQMGEAVRRSRVRAVRQARVTSWEQIDVWLKQQKFDPFKVVIKPIRSAGSDNVYLCESEEELKKRFNQIIGSVNKLAIANQAVVVQEYLTGDEYVVDTVSRDGVHKLAAVWVYDKRMANGAAFVYFGMSVVDPAGPVAQSLFTYLKPVLDALGIQHGPAHAEVKYDPEGKLGPCLVECGARPHGAEGTFIPIARRAFGRDQVAMTVDAYTDEKKFLSYSDMPEKMIEYGSKVDLVSFVTGKLRAMPHLDDVKRLKSYLSTDMLPKPGDAITPTIDCFSAVGSISLVHVDRKQVEADYAKIREWEASFFDVDR